MGKNGPASPSLATWGKRKPGAAARSRTVLTLYSGRNDLDSHRARLVLASKGVSYDLVQVDPANPPEDLRDLNPFHTLPTLVDRDLVLYDVNVIAEYIDERYPHPPLMPVDPLSRARVRLGIARLQQDWFGLVHTIQTGTKSTSETARKRLREALLAAVPVFRASKFFLNTEVSLADCALAPLVWRLPALNVNLPREAQLVNDYGDRIFRNPAWARSMTDDEKLLRG